MSAALENLKLIRTYLVSERRECGEAARALHVEGKPLKFEANKIVDIQLKIDTIDRAIADEQRLAQAAAPTRPAGVQAV